MKEIEKAVADTKDEALETLLSLLRIPSVSSDPALRGELLKCADVLEELLKRKGFEVDRIDAGGFPALTAEAGPRKGPAVLFYAHYDVQPARMEDGWSHDPFDPVVVEGDIRCRGASDDKGQLVALLYGVEAYRKAAGELPCRVRFLFEGAEEIGSPGFEEALLKNREKVAADLVVVADCGRLVPERPTVIRGLRGLAYLEVFVQGPKSDLHSGSFGGTVDNPAQVLADMVSALKDADRKVAVPGFYDDVIPPTPEELNSLEEVPFNEEEYRESLGVAALAGESGWSTLARRWLRPSLDINGLTAGFQGEGAKTVLPAKASCKLSCRIVPDQDPHTVLGRIEEFLKAVTPPTCKVSFLRHAGAGPVKLDLSGHQAEWVLEALKKAYGAEPLNVFEGATVPVVSTFAHELGIPPFPIGFGRVDDGAHGPDEKFAVEDFERAIAAVAYLLAEIKARPSA